MRTLYWILDEAGEPQPADVLTWGYWFERASKDRSRIVAQDRDERDGTKDVMVSTVFLGLDHAFSNGPPVLWETMIMGGPLDGYQRRYSTRGAALAGHAEACELQRRAHKRRRKAR
jgi:hypothetical protein